jgi:NADPH:quinone reductase
VRAVRLHAFHEPLRVDDVADPGPAEGVEPAEGEVLFEPALIGVNPLDVWLTEGTVAGGRQHLPFVPGSEAAGWVEGRRVLVRGSGLGTLRDGLYRERAYVPRDAVLDLPDGVQFDQAAGLGVAGDTAWRLVHELGRITASDRVLVLGASGGVGSLVVQLVKATGAEVWGQTTDPEKVAFVRELGAANAVVTGHEGLADAVATLEPTVAVDPLGDGFTTALVTAVQPRGRILLYGASAGPVADRFDLRLLYRKAVSILTYSGTIESAERLREGMLHALEAAARGELRVLIDGVLPLERAQEAHDRLRERRVRGKLLLRP